MADIAPLITFKAGKCDANLDASPAKIKPLPDPGYLYLYEEDDLVHFCWRARGQSLSSPELDLVMIPPDGTFVPYRGPEKKSSPNGPQCPANGRVFVLKFSSSSQRYFFWLQAKAQFEPNTFSPRDLRLGEIVNAKLQGEEVDVDAEVAQIRAGGPSQDDDDEDDAMEDVQRDEATGGAGAGATGGDVRDEGEESREGGADGARAHGALSGEATNAIQNFLSSLTGGQQAGGSGPQQGKVFTSLGELLPSSTTIPLVDTLSEQTIEDLLTNHLPPQLVFLEHQADEIPDQLDQETTRCMVEALTEDQKRSILKRVLRSPQFFQGTQSLTAALREGGMPTISEALNIEVANGGRVPGGSVPLGGGDAVEAFLEGIRKAAEKETKR